MRRQWLVNITPAERVARVVVGALAAVAGLVLLGSASGVLGVLLLVLLVLAGLDLVVTGALGHCPLYARLGHVPASVRGRTPWPSNDRIAITCQPPARHRTRANTKSANPTTVDTATAGTD